MGSTKNTSAGPRAGIIQRVALPIQGIDLFEETLRLRKILPTNCKNLDDLLEGGLFTQELTEVFGPPSVGKTQFALTVTSHVIQSMATNVLYFDTSGSFTAERLADIIQTNADSFSQQAMRIILSRVNCCRLFDVYDMLGELELLKEKLSLEHDSFCLNLKLIVVDSLNSIITPILGGKKQSGHALMSKIGQLMKEIASQFGISVLVLNSAVAHYHENRFAVTDKLKPSLGKTWWSVPHIRLFFNFTGTENIQRIIKVSKHPRIPTNVTAIVYVGKNGISSERYVSESY